MSDTKHTGGEWQAVVCTVPTDSIEVGDLLVIGQAQPGYGNSDGDGVICIVSPSAHVTDEDRANAERIVLCCNCHDDLVAALKAWDVYDRESRSAKATGESAYSFADFQRMRDSAALLTDAALAKAGEK